MAAMPTPKIFCEVRRNLAMLELAIVAVEGERCEEHQRRRRWRRYSCTRLWSATVSQIPNQSPQRQQMEETKEGRKEWGGRWPPVS
jgi:hypothetical protein